MPLTEARFYLIGYPGSSVVVEVLGPMDRPLDEQLGNSRHYLVVAGHVFFLGKLKADMVTPLRRSAPDCLLVPLTRSQLEERGVYLPSMLAMVNAATASFADYVSRRAGTGSGHFDRLRAHMAATERRADQLLSGRRRFQFRVGGKVLRIGRNPRTGLPPTDDAS
jgi:hypothetical protein